MALIVIDFDGTMANSLAVAINVYNQIAKRKGFVKLTDENWEIVRRMSATKALKFAGIKPYHLPGIIAEGRKQFVALRDQIHLFKGIDTVIKQLSEDHQIFVLSTNSKQVVQDVLDGADLRDYVTIMKSAPLFGKAGVVKKLAKKQKVALNNVWMIGDELRDAQAARKAKVKFIGVTWGLQPEAVLKKAKPTAIANKPDEITKIIRNYG